MFALLVKSVVFAIFVAALGITGATVESAHELLRPIALTTVPDATDSTTITVPRGATFASLTASLHARGIVRDRTIFRWYGRLSGQASKVQAGEYRLRDGETLPVLLGRMVRGDTVRYAVTFIEGWTFAQIRAALAAAPRLGQVTAEWPDAQIMATIGRAGEHPEGWFFPDTYVYSDGQSDLDILRRAARSMQRRLTAEWATRAPDLPYQKPYEALIMASIIEKETGAAEERARIAGVFVRRLRKDMKLQTDPTVIYGMGARYDGNIRHRDLREDTPYNTYVRKGLTPTPIANPGAHALHAALHPEAGSVLYFVSRGDGTHKFSDTYAEHKRAVQQFQIAKRVQSK